MTQSLRLEGGGQSLVIGLRAGRAHLDYWGPSLPAGAATPIDTRLLDRATPHGMLDAGEAFDLFPQCGHGFTGRPALAFSRPDGGFISQLEVVAAEVMAGEARLQLADARAGLAADLKITFDPATGVAGFRTTLRNLGDTPVRVDGLSAVALPAPGDDLLTFGGRWAREFSSARRRLDEGLWVSESRTGRTSHHSPPFLIAGEAGFGDAHGVVLGVHLAWSGNHQLFVERLRDGRLQVQAAELLWPGELVLAPGESCETPWVYAARSDGGLNGLSARLHPFVRDQILGGRLRGRPRRVHFNTWEAVYFRHDLAELMALADVAAEAGAERFVLDDGWFKGRNDDTSSLGDWSPDAAKFPQGLGPLCDHVRGLGLDFGLWVEPEMANADSDLLRANPDWILGEPDRIQPLGRGQYVLDLTRPEVAEAIFTQLDRLLTEQPIGYLKWDMNRDLTHPASRGRPTGREQTLAVYALIDRLRAAHPAVEIESCASGGGRADYEILRRTDRIWTSDCNDPIERQTIQQAFLIFFPPEVMGAHIGPAASHTTARAASLEFRALTALFGHVGIEADVRRFPPRDLAALKTYIGLYRQVRDRLHGGQVLRQTPPDPGGVAFTVGDDTGVFASVAQLETPRTAGMAPLRLTGLTPDAVYRVRLLNPPERSRAAMKVAPALASGEILHAAGREIAVIGLPMPILRAGEIAIFQLDREPA